MAAGRRLRALAALVAGAGAFACTDDSGAGGDATTTTAGRVEGSGETPVVTGDPIDVAELDGRIVFDDYEDVYTMRPDGTDMATGAATQLTDAPGSDGWPTWSPDGKTIAFVSERDDCTRALESEDCWRTGKPGEHHDTWVMDADGSNQRRVTPEYGHFVAWSPDGRHLLVSGHALYVVRLDGSGRVELRGEGFPLALGGIPDWVG